MHFTCFSTAENSPEITSAVQGVIILLPPLTRQSKHKLHNSAQRPKKQYGEADFTH
jgi:hypothetical protein